MKQVKIAILLVAWSALCARGQTAGAAERAETPAEDHPSNGVVELIVTPAPAPPHRPHKLGDPPEIYALWEGLLNVRVRNVSLGPARVDETDWLFEYTIQVLDASGRPVPMTERGKSRAEEASRPRNPYGYYGPASAFSLAPGEDVYGQLDISKIYQVQPGKPYTIKLKRTSGLPTVDEYGKPVQRRELSCTVVIDEKGVLR